MWGKLFKWLRRKPNKVVCLEKYKKKYKASISKWEYVGALTYSWSELNDEIKNRELVELLSNFPIAFHKEVLLLSGIKVEDKKNVYLPADKYSTRKLLNKLRQLSVEFRSKESEGYTCLGFLNEMSY